MYMFLNQVYTFKFIPSIGAECQASDFYTIQVYVIESTFEKRHQESKHLV
jgi:hypothetical protein